jgi:hypothetical protein
MFIYYLRKNTLGNGGAVSGTQKSGGRIVGRPNKQIIDNGIVPEIYDPTYGFGQGKASTHLRNIKIKKASIPKKYITFC